MRGILGIRTQRSLKGMSSLKISHYYSDEFKPFYNILNSNKEDSNHLLEMLKSNPNKAYNRFRNYDWYIEQREKTENWLYSEFVKLGGTPKSLHPLYFVLGESKYLKSCYGDTARVKSLYLHQVDTNEISFTLEDSLSIFVSKESHKKVYTYSGLFEELGANNESISRRVVQLYEQRKYIEVQVWNPIYCT